MCRPKYYYSVYLFALITIFSCKASRTTTDSVDIDESGQTVRSSDIIMVDKKLKETIESYFELISTLDQEDIEKRDSTMAAVYEYFNSPETPVFLVLYNNEGKRYYDKPMAISDYLYYLNDTRQAPHLIRNLRLDESQTKIVRVELTVKP